ncbi:predicted protein [Naegleria gruberi]|uniref:Predicted protein n=1 Tax=Naegleria gruberi TaxID=5762 RepID=D2VKE3_NAEGR|nr:uncharacterized protein NAEGRDRAFT_69363 [Naegleria gruberi]EFC42585.1 predicted protein [Naegleria gruberi]|eukprot:XP_002675329.1 predicted protein [Naegleria gruberi strain NEG-M]
MSGKVAILTGGNSGLGFSLAQQLACKGVKVILAVRNPQRGLMARSKIVHYIKKETNIDPPLDSVQVYHCDLSSLESVREFVTSVQIMLSSNPKVKKVVNQVGIELVTETQETYPVIDFLINNAGSIYPTHR